MARLHMRTTAALVGVAGLLLLTPAGCELPAQVGAVRAAITDEQVPGIQEPHAIGWGWPESSSREFTALQDHTFGVGSNQAEGGGTRLYVVEGKDAKTGQWRVLYAAKQGLNGHWVPIHLTAGTASPSHTTQATAPSIAAGAENDRGRGGSSLRHQRGSNGG